jgi:UDP-2,4-diacetamido-2,4,6-trideoxy-beta-L-altropyranose hydrolase
MRPHRLRVPAKQIAVRVDASSTIGTGHVHRCLTLARLLREADCNVTFLMDTTLPGQMGERVAREGFAVAPPLHAAIPPNTDWLILDHYTLDAAWETPARAYARRIMVIDDLANRPHDADLLLDQNLHCAPEARYKNLTPPGCLFLCGAAYALLRPEFAATRAASQQRQYNAPATRALITFGGSDADNVTGKAVAALLGLPGLHLDVVMGGGAVHLAAIKKIAAANPAAITLHIDTPHMAALMQTADIALAAAGTTTWERCCLGLPSLVLAIADNQLELGQNVHEAGAHQYLGWHENINEQALRAAFMGYSANAALRAAQSSKALSLVDGLGANRVAAALLNSL